MTAILAAIVVCLFAEPIALVLIGGACVLILGTVVSVIAVVVFATIQEAAKALVETLQKVFSPIRTQANDFLTACKYYYSTRHIVLEEHDGPEEFAALAAPEEPEDLPS